MQVDFHKKNILIVDDSKDSTMFLETLLKKEGYTSVFTASSAVDAYKILEEKVVNLLLLDIVMPNINGLEACKTIRENPNYSNMPIIMVTADTSNKTLKESFESGANDFINKPINQTNLKVRMESLFMSAYKDTVILNQNRLIAINDTVHMLSHQWRQPLAAISANTLIISASYELENLTAEDLNESLDQINDSVQSLSKTLDEFRLISKIEQEASLHNVNDSISKSLDLTEELLKTKEISVFTNLTKQKNILFFENELIKILINIYTNSVEAFKRKSITTEKFIKISTKQRAYSTTITIVDNAGGIDESIISRVFEPYFSTKEEKNGVGLGLYNALNVLKEFMNATITISSTYDETTVIIELPNKVV